MTEEKIRLKPSGTRINNLLAQLSGITPATMDKMGLLSGLYKEVDRDLTDEERYHIISLFQQANSKENLVRQKCGFGYKLMHNDAILNELELYLRKLLHKYEHFELTKDTTDYQLGEF